MKKFFSIIVLTISILFSVNAEAQDTRIGEKKKVVTQIENHIAMRTKTNREKGLSTEESQKNVMRGLDGLFEIMLTNDVSESYKDEVDYWKSKSNLSLKRFNKKIADRKKVLSKGRRKIKIDIEMGNRKVTELERTIQIVKFELSELKNILK